MYCLHVAYCTRVVQCRGGQKRALDSPGTGVKDSPQLPCGCWGSNQGPLQEQSSLLTARPSQILLYWSLWVRLNPTVGWRHIKSPVLGSRVQTAFLRLADWHFLLKYFVILFYFISFFGHFEAGSPFSTSWPAVQYVDQAGLYSQRVKACLCLLSAGIKGVHHHTQWQQTLFFLQLCIQISSSKTGNCSITSEMEVRLFMHFLFFYYFFIFFIF